ncbi:MAG: hypothetical protein JWQ90_4443 [Hydrocarboniphaga sp.]|uniref:DUF2461 domain-containing protein n=1 Tax=Hydrocarboniphaga sp. TaxID=2033016 RepID=UPI002628D880|nr:DUF2461 domain-containing protein [Hydrocarboniphaga sp.]MDB5971993.1 hypothetical protein [Hydrocarboniphaga sp.]
MPSKPKSTAYFTPEVFRFLRGLARNNSREWFLENKPRYEAQVREPALRLITDIAEPLAVITPQLIADPKKVGGSLFRIHRDTRFSGDKTPYKTHVGISFHHAATKAVSRSEGSNAAMGRLDAPILYLHIQPGQSFVAGGIWHPQPDTLKLIRDYLLNNPKSWKEATRHPGLPKNWEMGGEALSRPPRGYDPAHELIGDLRRKDFIARAELSDDELLSPDLLRLLIRLYRGIAPLYDWLCGALDLEF